MTRSRPRRLAVIALAVLGLAALGAAACAPGAQARGWAPPQPIVVGEEDRELVLVAHRSRLYAMPVGAQIPAWRFPPEDRANLPVSDAAREALLDVVADAGLPDAERELLEQRIEGLHVRGATVGNLRDAIDTTSASEDARRDLRRIVDTITDVEDDALGRIQAIYGDIGVSEDASTVYVATFRGMLFALNAENGHMRWLVDMGEPMVGGVAVDGDTIYVPLRGGEIVAMEADTGLGIWSTDVGAEVWATPALGDDGTLYVSAMDGRARALDAGGNILWESERAGGGMAAKPVVADGVVYVGAFDNRMYALDAGDGSEIWRYSGRNWFWGSAVVSDGVVYAADMDGRVHAIDAASGELVWGRAANVDAPVRSTPLLAADGLFVGTRAGDVFKLDPETGQVIAGPAEAGDTVLADLALSEDGETVFVALVEPRLVEVDADTFRLAPFRLED
jgi:outer membrane protein assembly factor BamB